jgi:hypothetical protein
LLADLWTQFAAQQNDNSCEKRVKQKCVKGEERKGKKQKG